MSTRPRLRSEGRNRSPTSLRRARPPSASWKQYAPANASIEQHLGVGAEVGSSEVGPAREAVRRETEPDEVLRGVRGDERRLRRLRRIGPDAHHARCDRCCHPSPGRTRGAAASPDSPPARRSSRAAPPAPAPTGQGRRRDPSADGSASSRSRARGWIRLGNARHRHVERRGPLGRVAAVARRRGVNPMRTNRAPRASSGSATRNSPRSFVRFRATVPPAESRSITTTPGIGARLTLSRTVPARPCAPATWAVARLAPSAAANEARRPRMPLRWRHLDVHASHGAFLRDANRHPRRRPAAKRRTHGDDAFARNAAQVPVARGVGRQVALFVRYV